MQYRLRTLLIVVTLLCVLFALIGRYGGYGLAMRVEAILFLLLPLVPISELLLEAWLKERGERKNE